MEKRILNQKFDKKNDLKSCFNELKNIISQTKIYNPLITGKQSTAHNYKYPSSRAAMLC